MSAFISLLTLNVSMAIVTFAAGIASIKLSLASGQMCRISRLGTGILVGTALGVVLPEGVEKLFSAQESLDSFASFGIPPSFIVGASVLSGFIMLFVLDHALAHFERRAPDLVSESRHPHFLKTIGSSIVKSTLTLSLIVHSFADGIALGVSFFNDNKTFQFLFFFMIVIHKIPTAFSLIVILFKEGVSQSMCKYHMLAFALATPFSSIITYFLLYFLGSGSPFVLGVLLLFSAGTFLFSVLHVMMDTLDSRSNQPAKAIIQISPLEQKDTSEFSSTDALLTIAGILLPLCFSLTGAD